MAPELLPNLLPIWTTQGSHQTRREVRLRYTIPTALRDVLGKSQVWKTTGTGRLSEAKRREPRILADIIDSVEDDFKGATESPDSTQSPESLFEAALELAAEVQRGVRSEDDASYIMPDYRDAFIRANRRATGQAYFKAARSAHAVLESRGLELPLKIAARQHVDDLEARGRNRSTVDRKEKVLTEFDEWPDTQT